MVLFVLMVGDCFLLRGLTYISMLSVFGMLLCVGGAIGSHSNGNVSGRDVNLLKKRSWSRNSDNEEKSGFYETPVMEERYRSMLGDHIKKYKRRFKGNSSSPGPNQVPVPFLKSNNGLKAHKPGNERNRGLHDDETLSEWINGSNAQKSGNFLDTDFIPQHRTNRFVFSSLFILECLRFLNNSLFV
jgi:chromatin-remodeling ATPase INO80